MKVWYYIRLTLRKSLIILPWLGGLLCVLLACLPLVGYVVGLLFIPLFIFLYYLRSYSPKYIAWKENRRVSYWYKVSLVSVIAGFLMQSACSVYSNYRLGELSDDCEKQKVSALGRK